MSKKNSIIFLFCFLFTLVNGSLAVSSPISQPWGMNAHLIFDSAKRHMSPICTAMKNAGVQIVRIDVYWSYNNLTGQKNVVDSAVFFADKNGLEILLNFPTVPAQKDSLSVEKWCKMLKFYAQRYNGQTPIRIAGEERFPKIQYFEAMNEPDYHYKEMNFTVTDIFELIKKSSLSIRSVRHDSETKIVMPGLCSFEPFVKKLLNYKDSEGKTLKDFIDIVSYHDYNKSDSGWEYDVKERIKSFAEAGLQDKEVWLTEFGTNMYETSFAEQASFLAKRSIVSLAYGIDKIFYYQFHYYGGNTFALAKQREDFYGMIDTGIKNSFAQFLENRNDGNYSIMTGDTPIRIYFQKNTQKRKWVSLHSLNNRILQQLQTKGLKISGKGFSIDSISLLNKKTKERQKIWDIRTNIDSASGKNLELSPKFFRAASKKERIIVYIDDIKDSSNQWEETRPFPVYSTYSFLTSIINKGSSKPKKIRSFPKGLLVYSWYNQNNEKIYILWSDSEKIKKVDREKFSKEISVFNTFGAEIEKDEIEVSQSPIFIVEKSN